MPLDLLRRTHRWIGLLIALPAALLGLSGAILALAELVPDQRATQGVPRPVGAIVAAAQNATGARATRYSAPRETGYVARVEVVPAGAKPHTLRIDPTTLEVMGSDLPSDGVLGWVRSLHVQFLAADYGGRGIGGWVGLGMLAMLVTAVPIWWPRDQRLKPAFTADFRTRGVAFHRRLHGAAGVWTIGLLATLTVTGVVMAFPRTARGVLGLEQREPPRPGLVANAPPLAPADIDRALDLAQRAVPDAVLRTVFLPTRAADAMRLVFYRPGDGGVRDAVQVQVDSFAGVVRAVDRSSSRNPAENLYRWMHDLHTGSGMGAWWRSLSSVAGLGLVLLSLTGTAMWWRRRRSHRVKPGRLVTKAARYSPE